MLVDDAEEAFEKCVSNGGVALQPPIILCDGATKTEQTIAEVALYGDCVLRFVSGSYKV